MHFKTRRTTVAFPQVTILTTVAIGIRTILIYNSGFSIAKNALSNYKKCIRKYNNVADFDSYYTEAMLESLFTPKQLACLTSGQECYVAPISFGLNFRYGWYCGAGYGRGEGGRTDFVDNCGPVDNIDRACQLHDANHWNDRRIEGENNTNCANELNLKNAINIVLTRDGLTPEETYAGKAILKELWFVGNVPCPPARFTLDDEAEINRIISINQQDVDDNCNSTIK